MSNSNNDTNNRKIALVTGSSRGLGRSMVLALARKGVDSVVTYRTNQSEAQAVVDEIVATGGNAVALPLDTGQHTTFASFAEALARALQDTWGRDQFDYLVNNAGHGAYGLLSETTEEVFDGLMNVHLKGVFFLTQRLLPKIADGGRIVNISSGLARFSYPGFSAYAAMKGAVEVLTRYWAAELGPRRITVNTVAPGAILTDFGGGHLRNDAEMSRTIASQTALGRLGEADDIGLMVASLLSEDNRWVNGQRIEVSGGFFL